MALTCKVGIENLKKAGDYVWIKYTASSSGTIGLFSDIATKTDTEVGANIIPITSSATPNGYFRLILIGYDIQDRMKLFADRNIQHTISWDALNSAGFASGEGVGFDYSEGVPLYSISMRLSSGGYNGADLNNEWTQIIVNSNLDGAITAGDNSIWNWNGISSLTSTVSSSSTIRTSRGSTSVGGATYTNQTTTATTGLGFRPVFIIEKLQILKYLFLDGDTLKTINSNALQTVGSINDSNLVLSQTFLTKGLDVLELFNSNIYNQKVNSELSVAIYKA